MERKLILNNGAELQDSYAIQSGSILWVYVYAEITFGELFGLLNEPENVKKIQMIQDEEKANFRGFKELFCIRKEDGGFISAGLRK